MNSTNYERAQTLVQALPYIQKFYGKTIVVKYGGNAMITRPLCCGDGGYRPAEPGGRESGAGAWRRTEISEILDRMGIESRFINGLRYTTKETMHVVQMVLCGKVNKNLVDRISRIGRPWP